MAEPAAVLLINHGSRQPHAAVFANALAATLRREDPQRLVAVSYLELNRPGPAQALRRLIKLGATDVHLVPLLFSAGYHYRIDVPAAIDAALDLQPDLRVQVAPPLLSGSEERLIAALDARLAQAIATNSDGSLSAPPDGLVMLAAGSSDRRARARVANLAEAWGRARGLPAEVAFCDLAGDDVRAAIARLATRRARHIVCGALFLASGRLLDAGRLAAAQAGSDAVAGPLGLEPALIDLIRRRALVPVAAG